MKIMILGLGKSGTTALLYKIAAGLPGCHAFSGGMPGKYIGDYGNAVYKHTYEERKGKGFDLYREHLEKEHYDRKVWIARDPRDAAVSRMLYRWNRGCMAHKQQFRAHLELVKRKEADPLSVPFHEICRYTSHYGWPSDSQSVVTEEQVRYKKMHDFTSGLGDEWFLFTYEDMVNKNFAALNNYLGFEVQDDTEVPDSTGKAKVVRKKATGDWRHWFTEEDVELFKQAYLPYMELMGYDIDDWVLSPDPVIEPEYSSVYMQGLTERVALDATRKIKEQARRLFTKKAG
jgi:hypothetical protein